MKPRLCFLLLWSASAALHAQVLDPTVPPAELQGSADGEGKARPQPRSPRLQSVLISPRRRVAVIDGAAVRLGQSHRGAVLEKLTETEAVLRRGSEREVLKLFPAPAERGAGTTAPQQGKQE